jgi:large subunit ribosomal protein L1
MAKNKRLAAARANVAHNKAYGLDDAIRLVKSNATAKFDETVEISLGLGIDPRHADQMVRGLLSLPNGTGKTLRVGVFARGPKASPKRCRPVRSPLTAASRPLI